MTMTDEERFTMICSPKLTSIEGKLDGLISLVTVSNGKPSLVARMDAAEKVLNAAVIAADKLHAAELLAAEVLEAHRKLDAANTQAARQEPEFQLWPPKWKGYRLQDVAIFLLVLGMAYSLLTQHINGSKRDQSEATVAELKAKAERMELFTKALAKMAGIPEPTKDGNP